MSLMLRIIHHSSPFVDLAVFGLQNSLFLLIARVFNSSRFNKLAMSSLNCQIVYLRCTLIVRHFDILSTTICRCMSNYMSLYINCPLPRSYVVKECRQKIDSSCVIHPTPGAYPGAQVSFREKLAEKLKSMVSLSKYGWI